MKIEHDRKSASESKWIRARLLSVLIGFSATLLGLPGITVAANPPATPPVATVGVSIPDSPIFVVADNKPNVLLVLDNSNSMDESATGAAVGSNSPESKSVIARSVVANLVDKYEGRISLGLMAYQQTGVASYFLHNSPYDVSYDPANYDPTFSGARESLTKRFRQPNLVSAGEYIYFNVALPYYDIDNQGNGFCYAPTAKAFNNGENPTTGPFDNYRCFASKKGTSDVMPAFGNAAQEAANGYSSFLFAQPFVPTDSDLAQGIVDFGKQNTYNYVSSTWFANSSPGRGYLHTPIRNLDTAQAAEITTKLQCNIPGDPSPCSSAGLKNAGLTPIEGTLLTAKDYFGGSWSTASEGYTSSSYPLPVTCAKNYVILLTDGLPSTDKSGNVVTDPALAINASANAAATLQASGVSTYVIGFALPFGVDPATLDKVAQSGGTSTAYNAADSASLNAALDAIFQDIEAKSGSSGATTTNSTGLTTGSQIFKASFNPASWSGDLAGYPVNGSGVSQSATWNAAIQGVASRKLLMTSGSSAAEFNWSNLTASQQTAVGSQATVDFLRGDRTGEGSTFRKRDSLLGDIIHSAPTYMNERASGLKPKAEVIFVGANDGMLHAFDLTKASNNELFGYLPAGINLSNLAGSSKATYTKSHKYFVDGQIAVSARADTASGKNILVAALGRGGRGAFALDVTDPANPSLAWDLTGANAIAGMEHILGASFITKVNVTDGDGNPRDAVVIPNGVIRAPATGANIPSLLILDLQDGSLIARIDAVDPDDTSTSPNGLSSPRGWDEDGNGTTDLVYAGDLHGNLWKFDLSDSMVGKWGVVDDVPLFVAVAGGKRQPITGGISISVSPVDYRRWIHFGTGQFLDSDDFANRDVQSMYGLIDQDSPINTAKSTGRTMLHTRTIASEEGTTPPIRFFESASALGSGKSGWYIDLLDPTVGAEGERVIGTPQEVAGQLRVSSGIPGSDACTPAGGGFIYVLDAFSGASTPYQAIDTNGDGRVDNDDKSNGKTTGGIGADVGLVGDTTQTGDILSYGGSSNKLGSVKVKDGAARGRVSWREILKD